MECIHYKPVAQASDFPWLTMDAESRWGHCGDVEQKTEEGGKKKGVTDLQANKLALVCFDPTKCITNFSAEAELYSTYLPSNVLDYFLFHGSTFFWPLFLFQKYADMNTENFFALWNTADRLARGQKQLREQPNSHFLPSDSNFFPGAWLNLLKTLPYTVPKLSCIFFKMTSTRFISSPPGCMLKPNPKLDLSPEQERWRPFLPWTGRQSCCDGY